MSEGESLLPEFPNKLEKKLLREIANNYLSSDESEPIVTVNTDTINRTHSLIVAAKDWPGIAEAITGAYHSQGFNISHMYAVTLGEKKNVALILIKIEDMSDEQVKKILEIEKNFVEIIKASARGNLSMRRLLAIGSEKSHLFARLSKRLQNYILVAGQSELDEEDLKKLLSEEGELFKFIFSRSSEYLSEREDDTLMEIVLHSYLTQKQYLKEKRIQVKFHKFETKKKKERLTGFTISGPSNVVELNRILYIIRETSDKPLIVKFQKAFTTDVGVSTVRIELTTENNEFLSESIIQNIITHLKSQISSLDRAQQYFAPGPEFYWRIITPTIAREAATSGITQMLLLVRNYDRITVTFDLMIASPTIKPEEFPESELEKMLSEKNISITKPEVKLITDYEIPITVAYMKVSVGPFGPTEEHEIYSTIVNTLSKLFGNVRDFDAGLRNLNVEKLYRVKEVIGESVPFNILKKVFYDYNDAVRLLLSPDALADEIKSGYDLVRSFLEDMRMSDKVVLMQGSDNLYRVIGIAKVYEIQEKLRDFLEEPYNKLQGYHSMTLIDLMGKTVAILRYTSEDSARKVFEGLKKLWEEKMSQLEKVEHIEESEKKEVER